MGIQNFNEEDMATDNVTLFTHFDNNLPIGENASRPLSLPTIHSGIASLSYYANDVILPTVFYLGIFGNIFNLLLLGARRMRDERRSGMERSAVAGLRALAVSDMMFCIVGALAHFVNLLLESDRLQELSKSPWVVGAYYYYEHRGAFLNVFIFTSTWLIVLVSVER